MGKNRHWECARSESTAGCAVSQCASCWLCRNEAESGQRSLTPSSSPNSLWSSSFSSALVRLSAFPSFPAYLLKVSMRRQIAVLRLDMMMAVLRRQKGKKRVKNWHIQLFTCLSIRLHSHQSFTQKDSWVQSELAKYFCCISPGD